jgi:hypothetical protein
MIENVGKVIAWAADDIFAFDSFANDVGVVDAFVGVEDTFVGVAASVVVAVTVGVDIGVNVVAGIDVSVGVGDSNA